MYLYIYNSQFHIHASGKPVTVDDVHNGFNPAAHSPIVLREDTFTVKRVKGQYEARTYAVILAGLSSECVEIAAYLPDEGGKNRSFESVMADESLVWRFPNRTIIRLRSDVNMECPAKIPFPEQIQHYYYLLGIRKVMERTKNAPADSIFTLPDDYGTIYRLAESREDEG